jgi:anaerobic magnesium-protoporphyrin IX monomethyl ester cyclase
MSREASSHAILAPERSSRGHVLLVGSNHQENLALQYLAASLESSGFSVDLVGFNERVDAPLVLARVKAQAPILVGLQIAFQYTVEDCLWLAAALRADGYRGHLTAGGHVATFCYQELLVEGGPLDSIVRHEGERTLVEMVQRLEQGSSLDGVAGCAFADKKAPRLEAGRPLTKKLDELPFPSRPAEPYLVAGVPIAFLITSRGCHGDCNYCCINAFTRDAGGPGYRLRAPQQVAEELAELASRGVRTVFLQDDLFILPSEGPALRRIAELAEAFAARGLPRLGFWIKGRPESITRPVLRAARELGAIHLFLGIENASAERLQYLGRTHKPDDAERALALCREEGVHPSFNVMLFDPESSLAQVEDNLEFLGRHADLPWNICRTEIYPGTHLFEQLSKEERLIGDYRSWGYRMIDPAAELLFRILRVSLHERALATTSLHNRLISLAFAWQLHAQLFPCADTEAIAVEAQELGRAVREDTVGMLRRAVQWVKSECSPSGDVAHPERNAKVAAFAVDEGMRAAQRDFARHQRAERLWDLLHARGQRLCQPQAVRNGMANLPPGTPLEHRSGEQTACREA